MSGNCPKCNSTKVDRRNYGKRAATTVGAVAGGVSWYLTAAGGASAGAEAGALVGLAGGPPGVAILATAGAIIGGILAALSSSAVGATAGALVGKQIDSHILKNNHCLDCFHRFSD